MDAKPELRNSVSEKIESNSNSELKSSTELQQLARQAIISETKRASDRASAVGAQGWLKPNKKPNARFLNRTILSALRSRHSERPRKPPNNYNLNDDQDKKDQKRRKIEPER